MMKSYPSMTRAELLEELERVRALYAAEKEKGYDLDMSRGKPAPIQLDLSMGLLEEEPSSLVRSRCGTDVRNYGGLAGIEEAWSCSRTYSVSARRISCWAGSRVSASCTTASSGPWCWASTAAAGRGARRAG